MGDDRLRLSFVDGFGFHQTVQGRDGSFFSLIFFLISLVLDFGLGREYVCTHVRVNGYECPYVDVYLVFAGEVSKLTPRMRNPQCVSVVWSSGTDVSEKTKTLRPEFVVGSSRVGVCRWSNSGKTFFLRVSRGRDLSMDPKVPLLQLSSVGYRGPPLRSSPGPFSFETWFDGSHITCVVSSKWLSSVCDLCKKTRDELGSSKTE